MASHTGATAVSLAVVLTKISVQNVNYKIANFSAKLFDVWHCGTGVISGTINEAGTPDIAVRRRVRLYRKVDGMFVAETWSALDGTYSFQYLMNQPYYVISFDHTGNYNAVVKDSITPEMS